MMIMDGSASQGLILHEVGHVFTYGILGNNEWRSGWMDEGLTDYQTDWAQRSSRRRSAIDRRRCRRACRRAIASTRRRSREATAPTSRRIAAGAARPRAADRNDRRTTSGVRDLQRDDLRPREADVRAAARRDGRQRLSRVPARLLRRWALKHVDERAMRSVGGACVSASDLGWFFDQWVHAHGPHGLRGRRVRHERTTRAVTRRPSRVDAARRAAASDARWRADARRGWTIGRADPLRGRSGRCAS